MSSKMYHHSGLDGAYPTKHHRQDTGNDCGQACAQMLLHSVEAGLRQQSGLIDDLAYDCVGAPVDTERDGWGANPGCLGQKLKDEAGNPKAQRRLKLMECKSERAASNAIVRSLELGGTSCAALIDNMSHWVTVYGYDIGGDPKDPNQPFEYSSCRETPYDIRAFYVQDPAPNPLAIVDDQLVELDPNFEHGQSDSCGRGILEPSSGQYVNWGLAYRRIRYDHWREYVFSGISQTPSRYWDRKYLAVVDMTVPFNEDQDYRGCDSERPEGGKTTGRGCTGARKPFWAKDVSSFNEDHAEEIRAIVKRDLQDEGLIPDDSGNWLAEGASPYFIEKLKGTRPCGVHPVAPPALGDGLYYYLVEMVDETFDCATADSSVPKPMPAVVLVDACDGNEHVLEMAVVAEGGTTAIHFAPPTEFIKALVGRSRRVSVMVGGRKLVIPDGKIGIDSINVRLVWEPVLGGLSPYAPFYRVDVSAPIYGETVEVHFFARADFWNWSELFHPTDPQEPLPNVKTNLLTKYRIP